MAGASARPGATHPDLADRRVLVVEDDATVREVVTTYLRAAGLCVDEAGDGLLALRMVEAAAPDLVVLDRLLPGIDGLEVARRMHRLAEVPIIMLTALGSTEDRIAGLEAGVDDYVAKPFSARELVLRVQSVLRRSLAEFAPEVAFDLGEFRLDPNRRTVWQRGTPLRLSSREYELLAFLLKHPDQVFTREQLLRSVWRWEFGDLSTVTVHVRRVREKIEHDVARPAILTTVWGVGYQLSA
ncbi:response regulator transcription factor [Microlunatus spumicola]|uniref:Response regulator transcription factor n=1 Tax=Microlunatus spumicola TaxID=81499 RepID=A0ABP6Y0W3_9ACTN